MNSETVRVWDLFVRVFHWSLVALFVIAWLTGEEAGWIHNWSGYAILALVLARIAWGLVGSRHARFTDCVRSPVAALRYVRGLVDGSAPRPLGHNPAGAWMAILLLATLLAASGSGLVVLGLEGAGPLAGRIDTASPLVTLVGGAGAEGEDSHEHEAEGDDDEAEEGHTDEVAGAPTGPSLEAAEETWEEVHELFANLAVLLVIVHILGVLASSLAHRENLVRAMFTGRKRAD